MNKILKGILLGLIGLALLLGGFSGGFIVGHTLPFGNLGFLPTTQLPSSIAPTTSPGAQSATPQDLQTLFKPFWETWQLIHTEYVNQPVDDTKLMEGAINGMMQSLGDPHSTYLDPKTFQEWNTQLSGTYGGIGAYVDTKGSWLTVTSLIPDSPAQKAGLKAGDQIVGVDGQNMTGIDPETVRQKVIGPVGTTVHLSIQRSGQSAPLQIDIVRAQIIIPSAAGKMLGNNIAYVQVTTFGENTTKELTSTLATLMAQHPKGLILDLRDNGGGYTDVAVQVVSQFVDHGAVYYEQNRDGTKKEYDVIPGGLATNIPMVVLMNANTASSSEITAGALQDYGRAKLVGTVSYGKGSVQNITPLSNNEGAAHITIAHWLTPHGTLIDNKGLTPDVFVQITADDVNAGRDPQLDAAVQTLMNMINGQPIPTSMPTATPTPVP